ncbi:protein of unknown function (plasmid) [Pararobbsia alpina]
MTPTPGSSFSTVMYVAARSKGASRHAVSTGNDVRVPPSEGQVEPIASVTGLQAESGPPGLGADIAVPHDCEFVSTRTRSKSS